MAKSIGLEFEATRCGRCGGEKDIEGWCADYCTDDDPPIAKPTPEPSNDRFCRHCGSEMAPDDPGGAYCRECVDSI